MDEAHISTPRIHQLPVHLANQIAAGEVIERPASVVKELVENSIDAGATQIDVTIESGGTLLIKVVDNGNGIHKDDLLTALAPHATSKIRQTEDLEEILTLGFRGEALASISSVARLKLQSRQHENQNGWSVGTGIDTPVPAAIPEGTHIEVRELFYNTPARKRFLRTDRTEYLQVEEVVRRLALSHFECGFSFKNNNKQQFKLPVADTYNKRGARVKQLFGKRFIDNSQHMEFEVDGLALSGWLGKPGYSLSQNDRQYVYLNGRTVKDRVISHALRQAYNDYIEPGRNPSYLLYFNIDPTMVDVNVHPTKHEVRFRDSRRIHDFLVSSMMAALSESVGQTELIKPVVKEDVESDYGSSQSSGATIPHYLADGRGRYHQELSQAKSNTPLSVSAKAITSIGERFIIVNLAEQMLLVDMLGLRKRFVKKRLKEALDGEQLVSQPLLFPHSVTLKSSETGVINSRVDTIKQLGIDITINNDQLLIRQLPSLLRGVKPDLVVEALKQENELLDALVNLSVIEQVPYNSESLMQFLPQHGYQDLDEVVAQGFAKYLTEELLGNLFKNA